MIGIITAKAHGLPTPFGARACRTPDEYATAQRLFLDAQRRAGVPVDQGRTIDEPVPARIDGGAWLISCECGNAPLTDPDPAWRVARCFQCGNVYTRVIFPADYAAIETEMLKRPKPTTRHSSSLVAGERVPMTLREMQVENAERGVQTADVLAELDAAGVRPRRKG